MQYILHTTLDTLLLTLGEGRGVEQARGIFYTTQDTLLLTCRGERSLLVVEGREKRMIIIA